MRIGLVTGSEPFAGLPTNPAQQVLAQLEGREIGGIPITTRAMPVSYEQLPGLIDDLVAELQPAFVLSLGLATGAPVIRIEKLAINVADFKVADNAGLAPAGEVFVKDGPPARHATCDAGGIARALLESGIPAITSYHAGTHLCNLTLYCFLDALARRQSRAPCGFIHLPYTPEQVARFIRTRGEKPDRAPMTPVDLPSMGLAMQVKAVQTAIATIARTLS